MIKRSGFGLALVLASTTAAFAGADLLRPHMSILGITLEETTLRHAQQLLGRAEVRDNAGDAGEHALAECYAGRDGTVLALISSGEMGGGTIITNFQLVEREGLVVYSDDLRYTVPKGKRPSCAALGRLSKKTGTVGGLRLGMTETDVRVLLGAATRSGEGFVEYVSSAPVRGHAGQGERGRTVRVEFTNGRATAIRAWQVTST
jgi:hypothetical protein